MIKGVQGLIYSIAFFGCISIVFLRHHLSLPPTDSEVLYRIMGKPLEKVYVDYARNIHFSVKTSVKNYRTRLSLLLVTWFQAVEKDQVTLITAIPFNQKIQTVGTQHLYHKFSADI